MKNLFILSILTLLFTAPAIAQLQEDVDYNPSAQPQFPGGQEAMTEYVQNNLTYPAEEKANGTEGRIFVEFVVDTDGSIIRSRVLRGGAPGFQAEALRVVNEMPKWTPGIDDSGNVVKTMVTLPFVFEL